MPAPDFPPPGTPAETIGLLVEAGPGPGVLHQLTGVIARHGVDITLVEILENRPAGSRTYFEVAVPAGAEALEQDLAALPIVRKVTVVKTFQRIYGKRIIIMGGGAQVGQVALGAISEADRHNIRGEHISVDTIPLVGEQSLADAVRAVARLPRARVLVLAAISAGSVFMGANTYIGNGPNFMVRAIAEERGVRMPSFGGYMLYSGAVLIPCFVLVTLVFFR